MTKKEELLSKKFTLAISPAMKLRINNLPKHVKLGAPLRAAMEKILENLRAGATGKIIQDDEGRRNQITIITNDGIIQDIQDIPGDIEIKVRESNNLINSTIWTNANMPIGKKE